MRLRLQTAGPVEVLVLWAQYVYSSAYRHPCPRCSGPSPTPRTAGSSALATFALYAHKQRLWAHNTSAATY